MGGGGGECRGRIMTRRGEYLGLETQRKGPDRMRREATCSKAKEKVMAVKKGFIKKEQ